MTRQMQVLRSIASYTDEHGHPPTFREIQDRVGLASVSQAAYWADKLIDAGFLAACDLCPPASNRTLRVTSDGLAMLKVAV